MYAGFAFPLAARAGAALAGGGGESESLPPFEKSISSSSSSESMTFLPFFAGGALLPLLLVVAVEAEALRAVVVDLAAEGFAGGFFEKKSVTSAWEVACFFFAGLTMTESSLSSSSAGLEDPKPL